MASREKKLRSWVAKQIKDPSVEIIPIGADASFRNYYRTQKGKISYIAVDANPKKENNAAFVQIASIFAKQGLMVPTIYAKDFEQGFMLLTDFGDKLLLSVLNENDNAQIYYSKAIELLIPLHQCPPPREGPIPLFDENFIKMELMVFNQWCLEYLLDIPLTDVIYKILDNAYGVLIASSKAQPKVIIHRDFHSRNLMILEEHNLGIIDFQDAMLGPVTYDVASLLKDCYISWPVEKVNEWLNYFYSLAVSNSLISKVPFNQFQKWFDLTGLQRHLKVMGNFSRLKLRDNKPQYIFDTPRVMNYIFQVTKKYKEFQELHEILMGVVFPRLQKHWQSEGIDEFIWAA